MRLEIGPQDLAKNQTLTVRRDTGIKTSVSLDGIASSVSKLLEEIQSDMFTRAQEVYRSRLRQVTEWKDVVPTLEDKCVAVIPWCENEKCEDDIKERSGRTSVLISRCHVPLANLYHSTEEIDDRAPSAGAKSLCIPFDQSQWTPIEPGKTKCPACGEDAKRWTLFGRSY